MMGNYHVRCGAGEKSEMVTPETYLSLLAAIPDFTKKISTMRSRGVHTHVIFQNVGQLQNRYPNNGWSEIIGACDSKLFLGCTDLLTAEFVSQILGVTTVEDVNISKNAGFESLFDFGKESRKGTKRNLLNPDEVLAYPYKNAILMLKGQKPLRLEKVDYTNYKESKELKVIQINDYIPEWSKELSEIEKAKSISKEQAANSPGKVPSEDSAPPITPNQPDEPSTNQSKKNKKNKKIKADEFLDFFS